MKSTIRAVLRTLGAGVRAMLVLTVLLGVGYPLVVTAVGQVVFPSQANGSLVENTAGEVVGSSLIGQAFCNETGEPLAHYFQPRPSAAGDGCGYDPMRSSGSNLGPEDAHLIDTIAERRAAVAAFNQVEESDVPPDAVTASGSGLDPEISQAYALIQIDRVADARGLSVAEVRSLVDAHTRLPDLGYLGAPRVNVVELNLALDQEDS